MGKKIPRSEQECLNCLQLQEDLKCALGNENDEQHWCAGWTPQIEEVAMPTGAVKQESCYDCVSSYVDGTYLHCKKIVGRSTRISEGVIKAGCSHWTGEKDMPKKQEDMGCPCCNGTGEMCCEDFTWLANLVDDDEDARGRAHVVFEMNGGRNRLGLSNGDGMTLFFEYCPWCGAQLG